MTINKLNGTECGTEIAKKINTIIDEKASVSLDNLDTDGQAILDGKVNSSDLFDENEHIKINKLQSYSLPSSSHVDLTLGERNSEYTAPADGWFTILFQFSNVNSYAQLANVSRAYMKSQTPAIVTSGYYGLYLPVNKGDRVRVDYNTRPTSDLVRFIYAVGSEPQS